MIRRDVFSTPEHDFQIANTYRIPVRSGIDLGATICRPKSPGKFPVLVCYEPYRSGSDGKVWYWAPYFARRGYAFAHLDVRGTGNSEGVSQDEYMSEETQDAYDAIAWLAELPFSNGKVGMMGSSYSGFTTLQVAVMAPPALRAIAPAYFTDRRYTDDCHYKGGCLRGYYDMLSYGLNMVAMNALPPYPSAVGERWAALWKERLEHGEPYILKWLHHQVEDEYWARGSIFNQCEKITAPSLLIGGWYDGYPTPPLRVFEALKVPKKLIVGPWMHSYPDVCPFGPQIDILFEILRWWDRWLKDMENGVEEEPPIHVYIREYEEQRADRTTIVGAWRIASHLPREAPTVRYLDSNSLSPDPAKVSASRSVLYRPADSRNGGLWSGGLTFMLPGEQNADEANALNYTSAPLGEDLHLLGIPTVRLYVSADAPVIPVAVRLTEVTRRGSSALVTKGILNGTRRFGLSNPQALIPGEVASLEFHLEATSWKFGKGNSIRLSVNGSDFPNVWPTPYSSTLTLYSGAQHRSCVALPLWDGGQEPSFQFLPPSESPRPSGVGTAPWQVIHDVLEDRYRLSLANYGEFGVSQRTPAIAWASARREHTAEWPGCSIRAEATGSLTSDEHAFFVNIALNVYLNDRPMFQKHWSDSVKREFL